MCNCEFAYYPASPILPTLPYTRYKDTLLKRKKKIIRTEHLIYTMGGCIPKEKYIKICSSYFPLFRRKICYLLDITIKYFKDFVFHKHILQEKNILIVLNADQQRYTKYIWLQNIIITID